MNKLTDTDQSMLSKIGRSVNSQYLCFRSHSRNVAMPTHITSIKEMDKAKKRYATLYEKIDGSYVKKLKCTLSHFFRASERNHCNISSRVPSIGSYNAQYSFVQK